MQSKFSSILAYPLDVTICYTTSLKCPLIVHPRRVFPKKPINFLFSNKPKFLIYSNIDVTPPTLTCQQLNFTLPLFESSMMVNWTTPSAIDNSGELINVKSLSSLKSPSYLQSGVTYIEYFAVDSSGNNATCSVEIFVKGINIIYMFY